MYFISLCIDVSEQGKAWNTSCYVQPLQAFIKIGKLISMHVPYLSQKSLGYIFVEEHSSFIPCIGELKLLLARHLVFFLWPLITFFVVCLLYLNIKH